MAEEYELTLRSDKEWSVIDGQVCRVHQFTPLCTVEDGNVISVDTSMPYASITIECAKLHNLAMGYICHRIDFSHLWMVFKERGIEVEEEVLIIWTRNKYKSWLCKLTSKILPKVIVLVCPKGAFELMHNEDHKPELAGEARVDAMRFIVQLKPEIMV